MNSIQLVKAIAGQSPSEILLAAVVAAVENAINAEASLIDIRMPSITSPNDVTISDNGIGFRSEGLRAMMSTELTNSHRPDEKPSGRVAFLRAAYAVRVFTTDTDGDKAVSFDLDYHQLAKLLKNKVDSASLFKEGVMPQDFPYEKGTQVILSDIRTGRPGPLRDKLTEALSAMNLNGAEIHLNGTMLKLG